jgi:hypothetical protein
MELFGKTITKIALQLPVQIGTNSPSADIAPELKKPFP